MKFKQIYPIYLIYFNFRMKSTHFFWLFLLLVGLGCQEANTAADTTGEASNGSVPETTDEVQARPGKIIFFGNSLTAAYGLDPSEGFPAIIQDRLDSLGYRYQVVNAGLSGETSAGGNERVEWVLQQDVDIFVLELGGNDGLRGIDPAVTYSNLQAIIDKVRTKAPETQIVLAGMEAPPNMGKAYTDAFRENYRRLARENDLPLIPFLLAGVGGVAELNLPDGIHPNARGQEIVAENVWQVLQPLLKKSAQATQ